MREVPGSIPSQGLCHTKDVMKMVPVDLALSQELRWDKKKVMDKIWYENPSKSEVVVVGMKKPNDHAELTKVEC